MSDQNEQLNLPAITPDQAKHKISIALTKTQVSFQALQTEADGLVFNEDNLASIGAFIGKMKKVDKSIADTHEEGKRPFLEGGRSWDTAKKDMLSVSTQISAPVIAKHAAICAEVDRKNREAQEKRDADKRIRESIEQNAIFFSQKIAASTNRKELNDVERLINLEKSSSRANKYGEFHQIAIDRFDELLLPILKDQKTKIDEKEGLEKEMQSTVDPEKHDVLKEKLEEKHNEIIQNQVKVQEQALSQVNAPMEAEVILPEVKARRTDIICELVDVAAAFKKQKELLNIELKTAEAKKIGQTLKDSGAFGDKDEIIVNGIKFTIKKTW